MLSGHIIKQQQNSKILSHIVPKNLEADDKSSFNPFKNKRRENEGTHGTKKLFKNINICQIKLNKIYNSSNLVAIKKTRTEKGVESKHNCNVSYIKNL